MNSRDGDLGELASRLLLYGVECLIGNLGGGLTGLWLLLALSIDFLLGGGGLGGLAGTWTSAKNNTHKLSNGIQ